jgi:hypothetical protein
MHDVHEDGGDTLPNLRHNPKEEKQVEAGVRLTLDIDGRGRGWYAWALFYSLRDSGEFTKVELRKTRRGYHVIGWGTGMSETEIALLRMALGDDALRVAIDNVKHPLQPRQVLWRRKNGWEAETLAVAKC